MKKVLLASTALAGASLLATSANAGTPIVSDNQEVEISGTMRFSIHGAGQDVRSPLGGQQNEKGEGRGYKFASDESEVKFGADAAADNGLEFGLEIEIASSLALPFPVAGSSDSTSPKVATVNDPIPAAATFPNLMVFDGASVEARDGLTVRAERDGVSSSSPVSRTSSPARQVNGSPLPSPLTTSWEGLQLSKFAPILPSITALEAAAATVLPALSAATTARAATNVEPDWTADNEETKSHFLTKLGDYKKALTTGGTFSAPAPETSPAATLQTDRSNDSDGLKAQRAVALANGHYEVGPFVSDDIDIVTGGNSRLNIDLLQKPVNLLADIVETTQAGAAPSPATVTSSITVNSPIEASVDATPPAAPATVNDDIVTTAFVGGFGSLGATIEPNYATHSTNTSGNVTFDYDGPTEADDYVTAPDAGQIDGNHNNTPADQVIDRVEEEVAENRSSSQTTTDVTDARTEPVDADAAISPVEVTAAQELTLAAVSEAGSSAEDHDAVGAAPLALPLPPDEPDDTTSDTSPVTLAAGAMIGDNIGAAPVLPDETPWDDAIVETAELSTNTPTGIPSDDPASDLVTDETLDDLDGEAPLDKMIDGKGLTNGEDADTFVFGSDLSETSAELEVEAGAELQQPAIVETSDASLAAVGDQVGVEVAETTTSITTIDTTEARTDDLGATPLLSGLTGSEGLASIAADSSGTAQENDSVAVTDSLTASLPIGSSDNTPLPEASTTLADAIEPGDSGANLATSTPSGDVISNYADNDTGGGADNDSQDGWNGDEGPSDSAQSDTFVFEADLGHETTTDFEEDAGSSDAGGLWQPDNSQFDVASDADPLFLPEEVTTSEAHEDDFRSVA